MVAVANSDLKFALCATESVGYQKHYLTDAHQNYVT